MKMINAKKNINHVLIIIMNLLKLLKVVNRSKYILKLHVLILIIDIDVFMIKTNASKNNQKNVKIMKQEQMKIIVIEQKMILKNVLLKMEIVLNNILIAHKKLKKMIALIQNWLMINSNVFIMKIMAVFVKQKNARNIKA